jgi:OOP family OmpA-OmpF porin
MKRRMGVILVTVGALVLGQAVLPAMTLADDSDDALKKFRQNMNSGGGQKAPPADGEKSATDIENSLVAVGQRVNLDVKFDLNSAALDEVGTEQLDQVGQALQSPRLKGHKFMLAGHTDDTGAADYNLELSKRRADEAREYLIKEHGVDPTRLETAGFGADQPISEGNSKAARKQNRRVVLEMVE